MDNNTNTYIQSEKKFTRNKWLFSIGGFGRDMVYTLVSGYFFMYVQFGLTLSVAQFATLSILIGVLGRIWDGINDPLMGTIIDGSKFKWGKFKPWIFIGAVLTGLFLLLMFNIRPFGTQDIYGWIYVAIMVVVYLLWEAAFTMNDIGYWGAIPSLSEGKERRDSLTSLVIFFAGLGGGLVTLCVGAFSPGNILNAYTLYSIIACIGIIVFQTMVVLTVKEGKVTEKKNDEEKTSLKKTFKIIFQNKQLLWISVGYLIYDIGSGILGALIYNLYYLEYGYDGSFAIVIIGTGVVSLILQALYPKITKRLTRKQIQKYSFIIMTIGYIFIALLGWTDILPFTPLTLSIGYLLISFSGTYFYIVSLINMTNCVEYNEYLTNERNEAIISSVRPLIVKFASATKSLLTTVILIFSGLYLLSQEVSNLETQKGLFNDRIVDVSKESIDDMKYYILKINEYNDLINGIDKESNEYEIIIENINDEINSLENDVLKRVQTNAEYIYLYSEMYILKYDNNNLIDFSQIKEFNENNINEFFEGGYKYEASFVFTYMDENNNEIQVNLANEVYQEKDSLTTRIFLRAMVTILPIIIAFLSYYIQNKKYIVNEEFYDKMIKEIQERKLNKE